MAVLRPCSLFLCLTAPSESSSSFGSTFFEVPSRRTRRLLIGASSLLSSLRTVKSWAPSASTVHTNDGE